MQGLKSFLQKETTRGQRIFLSVFLVLVALYFIKGFFVIALVNGRPVNRFSVIQELEQKQGREVVDNLITEMLIFQEAKRQKVKITREEIDSELSRIGEQFESQGQSLDEVLALQGVSKSELEKQIKLQKTVEKILSSEIGEASEEEINEYIEGNKDLFPEDSSEEEIKGQAKDLLYQQKMNTRLQSWLLELRESANINYFVNWAE